MAYEQASPNRDTQMIGTLALWIHNAVLWLASKDHLL